MTLNLDSAIGAGNRLWHRVRATYSTGESVIVPHTTRANRDDAVAMMKLLDSCPDCVASHMQGARPSHFGSPNCFSGSLASGGNRAHCDCPVCYR